MLNKILPDYKEIHGEYHAFAQQYCNAVDLRRIDGEETVDQALWDEVRTISLHGLPVEPSAGGRGYSAMQTCAAFEGFAKGCKNNGGTFSIAAHSAAVTIPVHLYGSDAQKRDLLPLLAVGKVVAANAITEMNSGSNVYDMETTAVKDGEDYVINGHKCYITNAPLADHVLLYCSTDAAKGFFGGISAFILPAGAEGLTKGGMKSKMGLRTVHMSELYFKNVRAGSADLLGHEGAGAVIFNQSMVWEKTIMSAMNLGQLERVYEDALAYCKKRKIKGKPLLSLTNIAHALADVKVIINASRGLIYDAACAIDNGAKDALQKSSIAKCFVTENAVKSIQKMQTMYGAAGYLTENDIEREYRDIFAALLYSGTTDIQRNIIIGHSN